MTRRAVLREIAHARAGDKGDTSNVAVFVYDPAHYPAVKAQLTAERVKTELSGVVKGAVTRYAVDHLHTLNFVMTDALEGGVNASLNLDGHGKSWSYLFLGLEVEIP